MISNHKDEKNSFSSVDSSGIIWVTIPQSNLAWHFYCLGTPPVRVAPATAWEWHMPKRPSCGNKCRPPVVHLCQQRRFQMPSSFLSVGCHNKKSWLIPMFTGQRAIVVLQPLTHWNQLVFYSVTVLCLESTVNASRCRSFFVTHQLAVVWPAFLWAQNETKFQDASRWFGTK